MNVGASGGFIARVEKVYAKKNKKKEKVSSLLCVVFIRGQMLVKQDDFLEGMKSCRSKTLF